MCLFFKIVRLLFVAKFNIQLSSLKNNFIYLISLKLCIKPSFNKELQVFIINFNFMNFKVHL